MNLQFECWSSCSVSNLFWKRLAEVKVDEIGKGSCKRRIWAFYQLNAPPSLFLTAESLLECEPERVAELGASFYCLPGELILVDSIEEFKAIDKQAEANRIAQENSKLTGDPKFFVLFAFADVKKYRFYHQISYPVLLLNSSFTVSEEVKSEAVQLTKAFASTKDTIHFADPSNSAPCWPLRQLLTSEAFAGKSIRIKTTQKSFTVSVPQLEVSGLGGWERSHEDSKRVAPVKCTDLSGLFDPLQLAKQAAELNLKLMKWRLVPRLDLEKISKTSCLLIGSGTLGCNISRVLLGWGFRKITFVDYGKVSYSNPVRQSLFTFEDAREGKAKALAAAERLKQVDPNATIRGLELKVPMPGHPISDEDELICQFETLQKLIAEHDAIFLLTDSRESRWIPSVIATSMNKITLTVALGFDSYVAMRHGTRSDVDQLSCYFCHDVIGPSDTMTGRSLDQQCTVTRPGLSLVAAGQAVELLVSLLQDGLLGTVPHQIRGTMSQFDCFCLTGTASEHCTACSPLIQAAFKENSIEFLKKACDAPSELERISGLTAMKELSESIISLSFDESEGETDNDDGFERL